MEEAYWKRFMMTGKVEDYLQFKSAFDIENRRQKEEKTEFGGKKPDAGIARCDSHCT